MKKIGLWIFTISLLAQASAQAPDVSTIKSKIADLNKQKSGIEAEIAQLNASIPTPIWKYKGNAALNFGQTLLGTDWVGAYGGNSNFNLQAVAHFEANYKKLRHSWENSFDGKMGFFKNVDVGPGVSDDVIKNSDMLQLSSKYLYDLQKSNLQIGIGMNFLSQFTKTYSLSNTNFLISDLLAPGTLDISPGMQWDPLPYLHVFFAPASMRMTFVLNDSLILSSVAERRFGNEIDERVRSEVGAKADILFEKEVVANLVIRSRAQLFNNWSRPQAAIDKIYSSRANVDVNWQTDLFYKLTKNIALNFGFQVIRDDDVRLKDATTTNLDGLAAKWQWRQNFGVGFVAGF